MDRVDRVWVQRIPILERCLVSPSEPNKHFRSALHLRRVVVSLENPPRPTHRQRAQLTFSQYIRPYFNISMTLATPYIPRKVHGRAFPVYGMEGIA